MWQETIQFAVLQKEPVGPTADQLKRAFKSFSHLTDADAVRLAAGARGILMKHAGPDTARAIQNAFQAEGIDVAIVAENDLPRLPEGRSLQRVDLWPQALTVYDAFNRPTAIAWPDIALVAAGAAQHVEINRTQTELSRRQLNARPDLRPKKGDDAAHQLESDSQLLLEILLARGGTRYQIDAGQFAFKYVIDRPGLSLEEKFIWLVREICHHATQAVLNDGARRVREGAQVMPGYTNRQVFVDEIVWLLWRRRQQKNFSPS